MPATAAAAVAPTPAPLKKVNLAGFAKSSPGKTAKTYPLLPDPDGKVGEIVQSILNKTEQIESLTGALELDKAELLALAKPFYFFLHQGQNTVASAIEAHSTFGKPLRVELKNQYRGTEDEAAIETLAGEYAATYFRQSFELKIKGDDIPEAVAADLIAELQELFARHNASGALTAKSTFKPTKEFHTARHRIFDPEKNQAIDALCTIATAVKTKLGKGTGGGSDD
jgi:hypothetical protein